MTKFETPFITALPMYDWPELRAETDAQWGAIRDRLRARGIDAPEHLTRESALSGHLDLPALWRHPNLLLAQTCWGPMELGLADEVQVVGQPDYSDCEGGQGEFYSSAILMRGAGSPPSGRPEGGIQAPTDGRAILPLDLLRGKRFAFNSSDSMSGIIALSRDLQARGETVVIFSEQVETGGHRASMRAVAEGRADVAAIDCRSWSLFRRLEPDVSARLQVVGWTARRKGLPYVTARATPPETVAILREVLATVP
ncbi:phosphate/phosphite/phosphonate ABC transporter substrate-binding protein [Mesorhizobium sp. SP-1A]|uniref:phosphate/phosphite/phosphonate ABC transporter substrate-binding protein n=1 Tax=Mesorhizobium sp. SP-1A TaxID=3077840 RepID=UPI0028F6E983|nr:PhnD/SsuA/transferrin family substrate-binding protein [Mesorhizobium sp. SP-1A]